MNDRPRSFSNHAALSWSRLERLLSGKDAGPLHAVGIGEGGRHTLWRDHGRDHSGAPDATPTVPFAELHAAGSYNFLRGAGDPEEMVAVARSLGLTALALVDRDGLYGAARFATAAAEQGLATVFGAELSVGASPLTVLCRGQEGYRRLSHVITDARMADRDKDTADYPPLPDLAARAGGHWYVLIDHRQLATASDIIEAFGADRCLVEFQLTLSPADADRNDRLHRLASDRGLREIVSAAATCPAPSTARLAGAKAALHDRLDVTDAAPVTHPLGGTWLHSGAEMGALAGDCDWLAAAVTTTVEIAEDCAFALNLVAPHLPHADVPDGHTEMSWLVELTRRGAAERYGDRNPRSSEVIDHELAVIEALGFPGYFLIVHDIVDFCRRHDIFCQGRGSAANSAVCYALGITNVDAVAADLLFERFLSPERDGPPDIDLDIESTRREEAIQYVYSRYGRDNAAQVANVITYRRRGALRDAARALGHDPGRVDAWSRGVDDPPEAVTELASALLDQPRHLGIHSGGMVICDRPIADVVPVEWARMADRSVVQWDKDDCAAVGLVKFDLLGLGMLEALHHCVDLVEETTGQRIELWQLSPTDPEVYAMLSRADAVGVFQVESRAQLATLPRLKPRRFYDLVVEVSLIRPGPIQGGSVHPYIRRRNGEEPVTYDHPCLEPVLERTLGIPLFQEQLMQLAVTVAGFSPGEADTLRRAMGSKRSPAKMAAMRSRFLDGARDLHGLVGEVAERLWEKIIAFASYGFPESHAQSFASLVYFSAWFKCHHPAEFCVALLRAQPMGFYSPQSLIADARRHGVGVLPVDVNASQVEASVEQTADGGAVRPGLTSVKGLGEDAARAVVAARPVATVADLSRDAGLSVDQVAALARAGALDSLGLTRRQAVWAAGQAATERPGMLPGTSVTAPPPLPGMSAFELAAADIAATGVTTDGHPVRLLRDRLDAWPGPFPVVPAAGLRSVEDGRRILVAGVVTHRQRPMTAGGVTFLGMEDETGLINVMVAPGLWRAQRAVASGARMLMVRGIVENANGAATVRADRLSVPDLGAEAWAGRSRDFR
ncbi:error-prone DNA polymerase [Corynebacterium terpenotabidum]|uniref:Error-prone DNA polymerase n=1 Tax=Corynebacterium terpenotabidum Y-11 TaxID=1200352 RepID=S4XFY5_9CORY|nr:error-prone DNA polymerase [Corynebacterium terpenotabidum]AGP31484.1 error-prone DNA polymerase [Corynebacterium terpenotabidum Y-11]